MEQIKRHIAILMATYNGEKYLREQIDSILSQTNSQWHLYIHDDGSKDETVAILNDYATKHPKQITVLNYPPQGGAMQNFMSLLEQVEADYYMFSDQDDIWFKDKIFMEIDRMRTEEKTHVDRPIIVFCDLTVVDANLNKIANSFLSYQNIHPEFLTTFHELAASNLTTGCTMFFNHRVKEVIQYPMQAATMHDAWITLCSMKADGILAFIPQPLIFYRQHDHNTLGAINMTQITLKYRLKYFRQLISLNMKTYKMVKALGYGSILKYAYYKMKYQYNIRKKRN